MEISLELVERMRAALPMRAFTNIELRRTLQEASKRVFPHECRVTEIWYMGDEGGISCSLDFGFSDTKAAHIVSITHLRFDRSNPLAREIKAYCKHRIKRIKKLHGGNVST
jgi:hypothetical protein